MKLCSVILVIFYIYSTHLLHKHSIFVFHKRSSLHFMRKYYLFKCFSLFFFAITESNSCDLFGTCWINPRRVFVENNCSPIEIFPRGLCNKIWPFFVKLFYTSNIGIKFICAWTFGSFLFFFFFSSEYINLRICINWSLGIVPEKKERILFHK